MIIDDDIKDDIDAWKYDAAEVFVEAGMSEVSAERMADDVWDNVLESCDGDVEDALDRDPGKMAREEMEYWSD